MNFFSFLFQPKQKQNTRAVLNKRFSFLVGEAERAAQVPEAVDMSSNLPPEAQAIQQEVRFR